MRKVMIVFICLILIVISAVQVLAANDITKRLLGRFLLQVQDGGRIWWVDPVGKDKHEATFDNAMDLFRSYALGISNNNLSKLKINVDSVYPLADADGDGYTDRQELMNGYNPFGLGRQIINFGLAKRLAGRFLLQTQDHGRVWYMEPTTLVMYEVKFATLMDLFKSLALGITNQDLDQVGFIHNQFVAVKNLSTTQASGVPYGSLSDTLYIFDSSNLYSKPYLTIKTQIKPDDRDSEYALVGDKIYFNHWGDKLVEWLDFNGNLHKLHFTAGKKDSYSDKFSVSQDGTMIAWVDTFNKCETGSQDFCGLVSQLWTSDINGENKRLLVEKDTGEEKYIWPIQWSDLGQYFYFSYQQGGRGGYIVFSGYDNLSRVNVNSSQITELFKENERGKNFDFISDISDNERFVSYFKNVTDSNPKLVIKNLETNKEVIVKIPAWEGFRGGSDALFSPDSQYVAYNIARGIWDDEYYRTLIVDINGRNPKILIDNQDGYLVKEWISNDQLLLDGPSDDLYIINRDGSNFKKLNFDETYDWLTYRNNDNGFLCKYPSDFTIKYDSGCVSCEGAMKWYTLELVNGKNLLQFKINGDGTGPYFPEKNYKLGVVEDGRINVVMIENLGIYENSEDVISTDILSFKDNTYQFRLWLDETWDLESTMKTMIESFDLVL